MVIPNIGQQLFIFNMKLLSGGVALMKILNSSVHEKKLKNVSQLNVLGIRKWGQ